MWHSAEKEVENIKMVIFPEIKKMVMGKFLN
jgi:hypothetical protein